MQPDPPNDLDRNPAAPPAHLARIQAIRDQIAELKKRWPAHSTPPNMMQRLDELEEQLETELALEHHPLEPEKPSNPINSPSL
jgi:hypothetical protein